MKKFTLTLFTLLCVICCFFALVACNDGSTPDSDNNMGSGENIGSGDSIGSNNSSGGNTIHINSKLKEDTDFAALVSDKVTQSEWEYAFSLSAFINVTIKETHEEYGWLLIWAKQLEGEDKYLGVSGLQQNCFFHYSAEDSALYDYDYIDDGYVRTKITITDDDLDESMLVMSVCPNLANYYADFSYNEECGCYVYDGAGITTNSAISDDSLTYINISVKIIDGNVAYVSCETAETEGVFEFCAYDYGTTVVNDKLPTEYTEVFTPDKVILSKTELTMEVGEEETLTVTIIPENATYTEIYWSSTDNAIATVYNGKVTALRPGTATITVIADRRSATCVVTVEQSIKSSDLTENTDFASLISDKVTQAEWEAAFSNTSFINSTVKVVNNDYQPQEENKVCPQILYAKKQYDDESKKFSNTAFVNDMQSTVIYSFESDAAYVYADTNVPEYSWIRIKTPYESFDDQEINYMASPNFADFYSEFEYSESSGAYVYKGSGIATLLFGTNDKSTIYTNISVKLIDGKVACIICDVAEYDNSTWKFYMYDYGSTTIELPTVYTEVDSGNMTSYNN